jgi:hypothetical protein
MSSIARDGLPSTNAGARLAAGFGAYIGMFMFGALRRRPRKRFLLPLDIDLLAIGAVFVLYAGRLAVFGPDGVRLVYMCSQIETGGLVCPGPFPDYAVAAMAVFSCLRLAAWAFVGTEMFAAAAMIGAAAMVAMPYDTIRVDGRLTILGIVMALAITIAWQRADALRSIRKVR